MDVKEQLLKSEKIIKNSPLKELIWFDQNDNEVSLEERINSYYNQIQLLTEKLKNTMNVVVMGEVKAGKSTLINAIVGKKIAPTDVLEATTAISSIYYSKKSEGTIYRNNQIEEMGSIEDIYNILSKNQDNPEYFEGNLQVSIGLPYESLKEFQLVDTPGLSTITEENEKKTKKFIQDSDVVLWVINANHIGQSDINEHLAEVAKMGKPIIGIINRIDELDSSPARIKKYVKRNMGIYLREIFCTSAKLAFEGSKEDNNQKIKDSKLSDLLEYLRKEIEANAEEIQKESIRSSNMAVIKKYYKFNEFFLEQISFRKKKVSDYRDDIERKTKNIYLELSRFILDAFDNEIFSREINKINIMIDEMNKGGTIVNKKNKKEVIKYLKSELNKDKVIDWWDDFQKNLSKEMKNNWTNFAKNMDEKIKDDLKSLVRKEEIILKEIEDIEFNEKSLFSELGQGATIAGLGGLGMAAYISGLGPAAASVTFGAALSTFVPPIIIGGTIIYGLQKFLNKGKEINKFKNKIMNNIDETKEKIKKDWLEEKLLPKIKEENKQIGEKLKSTFTNKLSLGLTYSELNKLEYDIKTHMEKIEMNFSDEIAFDDFKQVSNDMSFES